MWLSCSGVTHVAMESTGVCRVPIFNILEAQLASLQANAHHLENVPARKTDSEGLAVDRAANAAWFAEGQCHSPRSVALNFATLDRGGGGSWSMR